MPRRRRTLHPYIFSANKLRLFFKEQILDRPVPPVVDMTFLQALGFNVAAEYDQLLNLLHALSFINRQKTPTDHYCSYHDYTNTRRQLLAQQVRQAYNGLFGAYPNAWTRDKEAIAGYFESEHKNQGITVELATIGSMANTFTVLCEFCEFTADPDVLALLQKLSQTNLAVSAKHQELIQVMQLANAQPVDDPLSGNHEQFLRQAVYCLGVDAYRAAILMAWAAVSNYVREYLNTDGLAQLRNLRQKPCGGKNVDWALVTDASDLTENYLDACVIDAVKFVYKAKTHNDIGAIHDRFHVLRQLRNESAHQPNTVISRPDAVSYLNKAMEGLVTLSGKRVRQFA